jgi:antitoxin component YwqK of YwqJK toxin-antitoxin module
MSHKNNIEPYNDNGQRHGYWKQYHLGGNIWYEGLFVNDRRVGKCVWYWGNSVTTKIYLLR